jgi:hypothetical protein
LFNEKYEQYRKNLSARTIWNTKHSTSSFVFFLVVQASGRIAYVSNLECGSIHDKTYFAKNPVCSTLSSLYPPSPDFSFELCGDKAYPFAPKPQG